MASGHDFDPEQYERQSFDLVRRGFEPRSVQQELQRAAAVVRDLQRRIETLEGELHAVQSVGPEPLEARRVAEALGAEATQVLDAAHVAAGERAERAEREAEAVRVEAIAAADAIRAEANAEREQILADAAREAEAVAEDGRQRGRDMVNEAQIVRERMLGDLARKRQTGRAQVEQLRAGRDRLLESLSVAQASLDTAMNDLVDAVPEARAAAERAGLRVSNEPTPTVEVMEAEIESARLVGHPLVEGVPDPADPEIDDPTPDPAFITSEMEALTHVDAALDADDDEEPDAAAAETDDAAAEAEPDEPDADEPDADDEAETADEPVAEAAGEQSEPDAAEAGDDEPQSVDEPEPEPEDEPEPVDELDPEAMGVFDQDEADDDPTAADDIFARLRESQADDAEAEPGEDGSDADPADVIDLTDDADEPDDAPAADADETEPEDDEPVAADPDAELLDRAVGSAIRAVKKVLVEEQGTLLDGIRRSGGDAIPVVVADEDAHAEPYESAAEPALVELAEALGGAADAAVLEVAFAEIRSVALAPVRQRLLEVIETTHDADELSDTVRGLYRESRSRRLPTAIGAAAAAVRDAVTTTDGDDG